jgi:hypothetical protein
VLDQSRDRLRVFARSQRKLFRELSPIITGRHRESTSSLAQAQYHYQGRCCQIKFDLDNFLHPVRSCNASLAHYVC